MKKLRVAVVMIEDFLPPDSLEGYSDKEILEWKTEYDVMAVLEDLGHEPRAIGVSDDIAIIPRMLKEFKPHIVFNLLEEFHGVGAYVPFVLGYLELLRQPYTGCNPSGLMLTRNKTLAKKLLKYHRVKAPDFVIAQRGRIFKRPQRLSFPVIVNSTTEHGSVGISQASVVYDDEKLADRIAFVQEQLATDAIVEEFIDGRELYVGVLGNQRLQTLPIWELLFDKLPEGAPRIATEKVKWDLAYQTRAGIDTKRADLEEETERQVIRLCKRVYRVLGQTGYARMDLRLTPEGQVYLIESNPNPHLEEGEDFAESAYAAGMTYETLIQKILNLGLAHRPLYKS